MFNFERFFPPKQEVLEARRKTANSIAEVSPELAEQYRQAKSKKEARRILEQYMAMRRIAGDVKRNELRKKAKEEFERKAQENIEEVRRQLAENKAKNLQRIEETRQKLKESGSGQQAEESSPTQKKFEPIDIIVDKSIAPEEKEDENK